MARRADERPETIFARASGQGKSGVAVYRVSGPDALEGLRLLTASSFPPPRQVARRDLRDPSSGDLIDQAMVAVFPAPHSFTGEDVVEMYTHGSLGVERRLVATLSNMPGHRLAEAGEFTRRAFEKGRLDLNQVEGLADLIEAESDAQRRLALRSLAGEATDAAVAWRGEILTALALVEAAVDFADEGEDTGSYKTGTVGPLGRVAEAIRREVAGSGATERLRGGLEVAIVGPANSGKSLLINRLAGRDMALSTPMPGTTRDIIEAHLEIGGLPVTALDTAGLRDTSDPVEGAGLERAQWRARHADLRVHVTAPDVETGDAMPWSEGDIAVHNKSDLGSYRPKDGAIAMSAKTGEGLDALVAAIGERLAWVGESASPVVASERRRTALGICAEEMDSALALLNEDGAAEIVAEHLRRALRELERYAGRVDAEDVLDVIFARFCLGK